MNKYNIFLEALRQSINEIETKSNRNNRIVNLLSGKYSYQYRPIHTFETSIVESIVLHMAKSKSPIGWESSYPNDLYPNWGRSKLDIGLDLIAESKYLFKIAAEVKRWDSVDLIWIDIFKLLGYKSRKFPNAGENKIVLLFFDITTDESAEKTVADISNQFLQHKKSKQYFNNLLNKYGWLQEDIKTIGPSLRKIASHDDLIIRFNQSKDSIIGKNNKLGVAILHLECNGKLER